MHHDQGIAVLLGQPQSRDFCGCGIGIAQKRRHRVPVKRTVFQQRKQRRAPHATATQYIYLHDLDAFWDSIKDKVKAEWGPEKMPYGMMEFAIKDPDGYLLSFGEELDKSGQREY